MRPVKLIFLILLALTSAHGVAQYQGLSSQYMFNGLVLNPAYAGTNQHATFNAAYRHQWAGFEGAPVTQTISGHAPLKKQPISFGGILTRETIGVSRDLAVSIQSSYKLKFRRADLRLGVGMGLRSRRADWTKVQLDAQGDDLFAVDGDNMLRPEFSVGGYYRAKDWYVGYSIPTLLGYGYSASDRFKVGFDLGQMNHALTAGFKYDLNRQYTIKPSFLIRAIPGRAMQVDVNTNLILNDRFWVGASYRLTESVTGLFECQLNDKLRLGYSYDYTLNRIGNYSAGSHEMLLMYELRKNSFAKNPRYF